MTKVLSHPAAARPPDATAPPQRAAKGLVCSQCQRRFEETGALVHCPDDGRPLVRVADLAAADGDPMLGRVLAGRFTILARLGAGSMGTVYRAKQAPIGRQVAVKILRSDRAVDEVSRARFLREARANSLLASPNTVTVFDFGQSETGDFYLAMELLEGESLGQRLKRRGRMPVEEAIDAVKQALRSLSEAHAKGIIHRDLKPDNLFFARVMTNDTHEEIVKVLDFGIAKMLHNDGELAMNVVETQAGTVFGTPRYMSPEQAQGKTLDARSDLYSLGVILYHMITGRPPFTDDDAIVVMARHIKTMPRTPSEVAPDARIAPEVEALVMRVLDKEPGKRPDSAEALIAELTRVRDSAVVTSGVRASVGPAEGVLDARHSDPPPAIAPPTATSLADDTLSAAPGVPSRSRRILLPIAVLGALAALAIAALLLSGSRSKAPASVDTPPGVTAAAPPAALAPPPPATARGAVTSTIPTLPASALPRSEPTTAPQQTGPSRPARRPGGAATSRPAGTASVGYGYLE